MHGQPHIRFIYDNYSGGIRISFLCVVFIQQFILKMLVNYLLNLLTSFSYIGGARSVRIAGIVIIIFIIIVTEKKTSILQNTTFREGSSCV